MEAAAALMPAAGPERVRTLLSRDEIVLFMAMGAIERLDMNAYEMVAAFKAGTLPECPGRYLDLLALGSLLDEDDPLHVPLGPPPASRPPAP